MIPLVSCPAQHTAVSHPNHSPGKEYAPKHDASGILTFYMGKNTPERKDYIMDKLVVPVDE